MLGNRRHQKCFLITASSFLLLYYVGIVDWLFEKDYYTQFTYPLHVDMMDILSDLRNGRKPKVEPINGNSLTFNIENAEKCNQPGAIDVLMIIKSAVHHRKRRNIIRDTWGSEKRFLPSEIKRVFIVGENGLQQDIEEEQQLHGDIVQGSFVDSYYNLTIKDMHAMKWTVHYCNRARYVYLGDDDAYVSMLNLINLLQRFEQDLKLKGKPFDDRLFTGYCIRDSRPRRQRFSKWYVSLDQYPFSRYPPYISGYGAVFSYSALRDMYYTSLYTETFFLEDIYMGILAKKAGIEPKNNENFYYSMVAYDRTLYAGVVAMHEHNDLEEMRRIWEEQRSLGHA